jgi:cytochrome c553
MSFGKKYIVVAVLGVVVTASIAATAPPEGGFKNLKVLPKNISSKDLSKIMVDDFTDGLGVSCGFCHAKQKNSNGLDYASDERPEKQIARLMMKMTMGVNKKYFNLKHPQVGDSVLVISCVTCHNGLPRPEGTDK